MKGFLYRIGKLTLLLCSAEHIPPLERLREMKDESGAQLLCVLRPSILYDFAISLYFSDAFLCPFYEGLIAAAYHLSCTRGLPLYEYHIDYRKKSYAVHVSRDWETVTLNVKKYKQTFTNIDLSKGKYSFFADMVKGDEECLCIKVNDIKAVSAQKVSLLRAAQPPELRLPIVLRGEELSHGLRYLPYGREETLPSVGAYLSAARARGNVDASFKDEGIQCRFFHSHTDILCTPHPISVVQFTLFS